MTTTMTTTSAGLSAQKRTYLDVLAILHYVHAAVIALAVLAVPVVLAVLGFGRFGHRGMDGLGGFGCMELAIVGPVFLLLIAYALVNLLVGRWLKQRRGWVAIIVVSALNALNVPVGTLLGVFTIVVLLDEDVRAAFEGRAATEPLPPPAAGSAG